MKNKSIALVWTKYQFHILKALLRTLDIYKSDVLLIVFSKAYRNNIDTKGFYKVLYYDLEETASIRNWNKIKKRNENLLNTIDFIPKYILLRNFDSIISRMIMNRYKKSDLILFEEGTASYEYKKYLAYPKSKKEALRTIFLRFYFGKGKLRFSPFINKPKKAGLLPTVKPWLEAPCINLEFKKEDFLPFDEEFEKKSFNRKILLIEQPLEQAGLNDKEIIESYEKMLNTLKSNLEMSLENNILLKLHPSSDIKRVKELFENTKLNNYIDFLDSEQNFEELYFSNSLSNFEIIISFYSSGLYLAKIFLKDKVKIYSFSTNKLYKKYENTYKLYEKSI